MNITYTATVFAVQRRSLIGQSCVQLDATGNKYFKNTARKNALRIWSLSRLLAIRKALLTFVLQEPLIYEWISSASIDSF